MQEIEETWTERAQALKTPLSKPPTLFEEINNLDLDLKSQNENQRDAEA